MPGIASAAAAAAAATNDHQFGNGTVSFWSKHRDDVVSFNQLQKFWSELSPQARQKLLKIDKQMLFEQARKNMYCSRCNGLLLEGFLQIVMYGKSLQQEGGIGSHSYHPCDRLGTLKSHQIDGEFCSDGCEGDIQDPSVHPWGGLTTTREGMLTLLDCYLFSKSLKGLQNVFDSARARERERELLYPDACGGGGRGWISQGMIGYGRSHGTRETCALHTARLSVDTLVDFWSALGEETRLSLLRMKEEDFIERLMYRFDSKRFCRDCRRNVIREFKELKELKRMRREPRCTSWFCVADSAFQYEVSHDSVQADWHQTFVDTFGTYHHFEWAVGSGEGKSDILDFENVGLSGRVQVKGLDLSGLNSCYITLRAWKMDGRCTELSVKAHALKGQHCVHCRLVVGDGFVTITRGESIRRFFEHAEEAEEEEDDDSMDKDGNDLDGECTRPQKHAKSPELAREFLLDAATVEKAFREGTARQNAHSIFVCLALKLLEDRVHVACKEIITLEKQMKLLEEEEKEKREEEERKERRRTKEREKKLRRKERLREKEKKFSESSNKQAEVPEISDQQVPTIAADEEESDGVTCNVADSVSETGEAGIHSGGSGSSSSSPDIQDEQQFLDEEFIASDLQNHHYADSFEVEFGNTNDDGTRSPLPFDHSKYSRHKQQKFRSKEFLQGGAYSKWFDRRRYNVVASENGSMVGKYEPRQQSRNTASKSNVRNVGFNYGERFSCPSNRIHDRHDSHGCSCNQYSDYRPKAEQPLSRVVRENKAVFKSESTSDMSKSYHHRVNHFQVEFIRENCGRSKSKPVNAINHTKKVWEPLDSQKKYYTRSNSDSDVTLRSSTTTSKGEEASEFVECSESSLASSSDEVIGVQLTHDEKEKTHEYKIVTDGTLDLSTISSSSNSDNCSSCLSEGDSSNTSSSLNHPQNTESSSSSSDSEDASQNSEGREITSVSLSNGLKNVCQSQEVEIAKGETTSQTVINGAGGLNNACGSLPLPSKGGPNVCVNAVQQQGHQPLPHHPQLQHNQGVQYSFIHQSSPMGYYHHHQSPLPWPAAAPPNGFMAFPNANQYVFANPYGYGLNGNTAHFMQYPPPALLNRNHVPVYQPIAQSNGIINGKDLSKISNLVQRDPGLALKPMDIPATAEKSQQMPKAAEKSEVGGNTGFSLFHFGGPVDLSTGLKSETPAALKDEVGGKLSSKLSADHNNEGGDQNCDTKSSIEEYNLFAASNGIKFSFF
ncbi:OLC1v1038149C1 [Oldenlandia corymbosa var. corymbosa]|uniref:OLC1v1038149C1 n=1 Tax=Oldenlandia corymbosa var. corymbosa TaxID=529605 RepID=A0AAV1D0B6_OLDCO|nr:OLC1v1038149C1 [Oldenlandia corymbosa var. corymbosa]